MMTRPTGTNRIVRRYLAAIDAATGAVTGWYPNDPTRLLYHTVSPVSALAADGTYLYFASATTGEVQRADLGTATVDQHLAIRRLAVQRTAGRGPGDVREGRHGISRRGVR